MKNLFKSLVASALFLAVSSASAGTLYWQVSNADSDFDEAYLIAENKNNSSEKFELDALQSQGDKRSTILTQTDISAYESDSYLFYVEMVNYATDPETVTTGYKYGYGDLVSSGYVAANPLQVTAAQAAASGASLANVPEPSSGLLLLIGGAMLALRRRRQK